jgi:hypothetical protein
MVYNFIQTLQNRRCNYNHPDQATSQANSLFLLSSGIYTEEERFVFELLQNAVDAHNDTSGTLNIKMLIEENYFVFLHNGDAFTKRDIEGLCDVGNGNKMQDQDVKKIGYKGIGFKSVFMRSSYVVVESGGYCFKFDKSHWENYWDLNWNQEEFGNKDEYKKYLMPWQIIPIEAQPPIKIESAGFNVVTYIKINNIDTLTNKIAKLLSNSQFLLFLKTKNIQIDFIVEGQTKYWISKSESKHQVILSANGIEESRWLKYTNNEVVVPQELKESISADINTPDKLKNVKTFDLSFAIALGENGTLKRLEKEESVVYTYLPTSYRFGTEGFPFLVNANFITDAGRQQLHKDSEWNKLIFSKIPYEFLTWIKELSTTHKNYWEVLPEKSYGRGNSLETIYADEMEKAIKEIAFIPSLQNATRKVLISEAFMDRMGISDAISSESLVNHINRNYSRSFDIKNQISNIWKGSKILQSYGVFIFDKQKLKKLFEDKCAFENISIELNIKLINYLFEYYSQNRMEQEELLPILQSTQFLLDENNSLSLPGDLFFPSSYKEQNALAENAKLLHNDIYNVISSNKQLVDWLSKLGIAYLSDLTFIENELCKSGYITEENAIEVGKFVFHVSQTEDLFAQISKYKLSRLKFLTTKGSLKSANDLYLSEKYKPELNIEQLLDEDIYISEKYCEDASFAEWKVFFAKMGVKEDISNQEETIKLYGDEYNNRYDKPFFDNIKEYSEKYKWIAYEGWDLNSGWGFSAKNVFYKTFSFLSHCNSYKFSKLVFSKLLSKYSTEEINTNVSYVEGSTGFPRIIEPSQLVDLNCNIDHFKWVIENCAILPTVKQDCRKAIDTYSNSIPQIKEIAGNYLPIIDVEEEISESWQAYLGLKNYLTIEDYLFLLTEFAVDTDNAANNRNSISCIYQKLIEFGCLDTERLRNQITNWATQNKICSENNIFMAPSKLSYITIDGFDSKNRVYIGNPSDKEKVIELLALMGVKIITSESLKTEFEAKTESNELKDILKGRISALALLASGENADESTYRSNKSKLVDLIEQTYFYHCKKIKLTYGNSDDVIEKHTFGNKNEFYYIGDLRPANLEPLLTSLCKYLELKNKERELFLLFIEDMDGIRQNLEDKGYNVSLLEEDSIVESGNIQTSLYHTRTESQYERDVITGFKGEIIVYEKLISMGYHPECLSISTQDDYTHKVKMNGKTYFCKHNYEKYDISFMTNNGVQMFVEVKATTLEKQFQENLPISYRELTMIEQYNESDDKSYIIVRVFGVDKPQQDIYMFKGHLFNEQ